MKKEKKTIEGLVKMEWKDISLKIEKQKKILYLVLSTDAYQLKIIASKEKCWFDDYQEPKERKDKYGK